MKVVRYGLAILSLIALASPLSIRAQEPVQINVQGNQVEAVIHLAGGISADFTLTFENSVGLNANSIGLTAELVDVNDLTLLSRLPDSLQVSLPAAFPMMITVEPPANAGFSFSGLATIDIHTHNLEYTAGTPLRLFKAPLGGQFEDITMTMGAGSYRARGTTGKFSQFLILADLRIPGSIVETKFDRLSQRLSSASDRIETNLFNQLSSQLAAVEMAIDSSQYQQASELLNEFNRTVSTEAGSKIPNVWRSSRDIENIAGELMAYANTLRFSLRLIN